VATSSSKCSFIWSFQLMEPLFSVLYFVCDFKYVQFLSHYLDPCTVRFVTCRSALGTSFHLFQLAILLQGPARFIIYHSFIIIFL
jgi:hypothetical protein